MRRVEYDIEKSNYRFECNHLIFYFSSSFNRLRFKDKYSEYLVLETNKLKAKYHVNINAIPYLLIAFYKKIEKRGFRVLTYNENNDIIDLKEDYVFKIS